MQIERQHVTAIIQVFEAGQHEQLWGKRYQKKKQKNNNKN